MNAAELAGYLQFEDVESFDRARAAGQILPPDTIFDRRPYWSRGSAEQMAAEKNKVANPGQGKATSKTNDKLYPDNSAKDPLIQWHALGKNAAKAQQYRRRNRGGE